jgi:hypothetical protein
MFEISTQAVQIVSLVISALALGVAAWLYTWVKSQPSSNARIAEIGEYIRKGANTFLKREYLVLTRFTAVAAILIVILLPKPIWSTGNISENIFMALSYIFGTVLSALAGKIGIQVATIANMKAAEAATKGVKPSFMAGFRGGAVNGIIYSLDKVRNSSESSIGDYTFRNGGAVGIVFNYPIKFTFYGDEYPSDLTADFESLTSSAVKGQNVQVCVNVKSTC